MALEDMALDINEVDINFLIVGHTHTHIDQRFSVIARKITDTYFVG